MKRFRGDDGVYAILYAMLVVVVFGMASIVVDLGQLRADKREGRGAADTGSLAGAADLGIGPYNPLTACATAWGIALDSLELSPAASPCAVADADGAFVNALASCPATPNTATGTVPGEGVTIVITWPVPANSLLLTQPDGKPGSTARPTDAAFDGSTPGCDRLAVSVRRTRSFGLANALGTSGGASSARSVARATFSDGDGDLFYPLIILDPISCFGLNVTGGTKVLVKNKGEVPGRIGLDSNGTATSSAGNSDSCGLGSARIVDADGTGGRIEARPGAVPSATPIPTPPPTAATAAIEIYGPDVMPTKAYDSGDVVCGGTPPSVPPCITPEPVVSAQRITRLPFDKVYNCPATCPGGSAVKAYIERFRTAALALTAGTALTAGWQVISGVGCNTPPPITGSLRYFVDCSPYKVGSTYAFPPGSTVVINGDLLVENAGCLVVNALTCAPASAPTGPPTYLSTNGLLSVRGDVKSTGSGPQLILPQTFLHQPLPTSRFNGSFGGVISWSAPYSDPDPAAVSTACPSSQTLPSIPPVGCFRNLAFWTETASSNTNPAVITGGGVLKLEGTFFLGNAKLKLSGGSSIDVENAQFVAKRIEATGGSLLTFIPNAERTTPVQRRGVSLVR